MFFFVLFCFFEYAFLFVMIRPIEVGDPLKQIGFFIRYSKLKESSKSCKFLSSRVILKCPNNITYSYVHKYMERILYKLPRNTDLLCSGGLYAPTINHFFQKRFISRKKVSLSSLCKFNCFKEMLSLTYMHRLPPKLSLPCLNIL